MTASYNLVPFIDTETIGDKTYSFMYNGSIARHIEFSGIDIDSVTDGLIETIITTVNNSLSQLPDQRLDVQFSVKKEVLNSVPVVHPLDMPPYLIERNRFLREELIKSREIFQIKIYVSVISHANSKDEGIFDGIKRAFGELKKAFVKNQDETLGIDDKFEQNSLAERIRRVDSSIKNIKKMLESIGGSCKLLNTRKEVLSLYRSLLAPEKFKFEKEFDLPVGFENVRRELVGGKTLEMNKYMIHDETFIRGYTLDNLSMDVPVNERSLKKILDCPFEYYFVINFRKLEYTNAREKISTNIAVKRLADDMENANQSIKNVDVEKEREEAELINQKFTYEGSVGFEYSMMIFIMENIHKVDSKNEERFMNLNDYIYELDLFMNQYHFSKFARSAWTPNVGAWETYVSNLPGFVNLDSFASKKGLEFPESMPFLLPLYNNIRDDIQYLGTNHFFTDYGTILPFSNFDPKLNSWNMIVTGDMGYGKSVFMNTMIGIFDSFSSISNKETVTRIVDYGGVAGSYYKQAKMKKGTILNFSTPKKPSIDPFFVQEVDRIPLNKKKFELAKLLSDTFKKDYENCLTIIDIFYERKYKYDGVLEVKAQIEILAELMEISALKIEEANIIENFILNPGECKPNIDKMNELSLVVETILGDGTSSNSSDREKLWNWFNVLYESKEKSFPKMFDFYNFLVASDAPEKYSNRVRNFTRLGEYKMFDRDTDVDFANNFIIFDLYGLEEHPKLEQIYTYLIMGLVKSDMYKKQDRSRLFIMDEAWAALKNIKTLAHIEAFSRTARKYKFSMIIGTQMPTDFFSVDPAMGKVITSLASRHIYCGFSKAQVIKETIGLYDLPQEVYHEMKNLGPKESEGVVKSYARFMMVSDTKKGQQISFLRNVLSPLEYCLYSSSAEDNAIFRYYHDEQKEEAYEIIKKMAKKGYVGDKGLIKFLSDGNFLAALKMAEGKGK